MTGPGVPRPLAVVSGGSRGIGAATVRELVARGYAVDVLYREAEDAASSLVGALGGQARAVRLDVRDEAAVADYAAGLDAADAALDVLVCNAGVARDELLMSATLDAWTDTLATNLTGTFLLVRALAPLMMDRRRGSVITVSSSSASTPGIGQAAYAASKGGVEAFTRAAAAELRRFGIRVNCVAPGRVRTDMTEAAAEAMDAMAPGPWGAPEDLARVIAWLASDDASYVQGQVISADGGIGVSRGTR